MAGALYQISYQILHIVKRQKAAKHIVQRQKAAKHFLDPIADTAHVANCKTDVEPSKIYKLQG